MLMKKLLTALVIFVYFVPLSVFLAFYLLMTTESSDTPTLEVFIIPILFMLVVCILVVVNIAVAVISSVRVNCLSFRFSMTMKLCLIPFYIVNFACWSFSLMIFHISLVIWPLIPFIIIYTYFTMFGTSIHVIAMLFTLRRNNVITTKQLVIHSIMQCIFVLDVFDSIYLSKKQRSFENILIRIYEN